MSSNQTSNINAKSQAISIGNCFLVHKKKPHEWGFFFWSGIRESKHRVALNIHRMFKDRSASSSTPFRTSLASTRSIPYTKKAPHRVLFDAFLERDTGIEPVPRPWKGLVLPLYKSRKQ